MNPILKKLNLTETLESKHKLAIQINITGIFGFSVLALYSYLKEINYHTFLFCLLMCLFSLSHLVISKKHNITYWILSLGSSFAIQYSTIALNENHITHYPDFLWIIPCILIAFYGLGYKIGSIFLIINITGICYFVLYKMNDHINKLQIQDFSQKLSLILEVVMCLFLIGSFIAYYIKSNNSNIEKLKKLNEELEIKNQLIIEKNDEKTILIKEIHHRVKNNLQIIVSLLRLQLNNKQINNDEILIKLTNRVHSMSLVHQKLYQKEDLSSLNLNDYIIDLFEHIKNIFDVEKNIILNLESTLDDINYENMIPIGLIFNELISNSFKYAFEEKRVIHIKINKTNNDKISIKYNDLSSYDLESINSSGFGIELIKSLVEQINGVILQENTTKEIIF